MPTGMAMTLAINSENIVRKKVGSARWASAVSTGWLRKMDWPRSPLNRLPKKYADIAREWTDRARVCCAARRCPAAVASGPSITAAGSPGVTRTMMKTIVTTSEHHDDHAEKALE